MVKVGDKAPEFEAITAYHSGKFTEVSLHDHKGQWVILFFYPRDFTFVCPTELEAFAEMESEFKELGAQIIAASTDSEFSHKAWFERDLPHVKYPVLADTSHRVASDYNVLLDSGEALRGTFIIDPEGTLRHIVVSDNSVGRSVRETLRALQALQTGELCPIDWQPGQKTLGRA